MSEPATIAKRVDHSVDVSSKQKQQRRQKRPRERDGASNNKHDVERQNYYDRLLHQCRKALHKQSKTIKAFERQKLIRKIKENNEKSEKGSDEQERRLAQLKQHNNDEQIVQECLRRLGILQLDPNYIGMQLKQQPTNSGDDGAATTAFDSWIMPKILSHKKMIDTLEHWNEQVTDYRRWCLKQQDRELEKWSEGKKKAGNTYDTTTNLSKKKKKKRHEPTVTEAAGVDGSSGSMFVTLGTDDKGQQQQYQGTDNSYFDSQYGPNDDDDDKAATEQQRKNRPGQRARRAKGIAIQARREGRMIRPDESTNWRKNTASKTPRSDIHNNTSNSGKERHQLHGSQLTNDAAKTTNEKQEVGEQLHPSWQARKEQKAGIVAFQGKKITFD
jgi:BUD22